MRARRVVAVVMAVVGIGAALPGSVFAAAGPNANCEGQYLSTLFSSSPGGESPYVRGLPPGDFGKAVVEVRHPGGSTGMGSIGQNASTDCGTR